MYLGQTGPVPKKNKRQKAKEEVDKRGNGLTEREIQTQCESLLDQLDIVYIRIPDAVYSVIFGKFARYIPLYVKRLISAFIKGLPDLTILSRCGKYYCVELKKTDGKQSQGQKKYETRVGSDNYYIIRSVQGLVELIKNRGIR